MRGDVGGDMRHHPGLGIADHEAVEVQRFKRVDGVEHALALGARGQLHFQIDDFSAQAPGCELEGDAGAGRGLGEQITDREAGKRAVHGRTGAARAHVALRVIEERVEFSARQALERGQVLERAVAAPLLVHELNLPPAANARE